MPQLYVVTFAVGALTVFFQIAAISVLPTLVDKSRLVEANGRLSTSDALIAVIGPAAAGGLVQLVGAARVILIDAISYILSAAALWRLPERDRGPAATEGGEDSGAGPPATGTDSQTIRQEVAEGIYELLRTPLLRTLTITSSLGMLAGSVTAAVQMLFLVDQLELSPATIGIVLACGGVGSLTGAMISGRAARFLNVGTALIWGKLVWIAGSVLLAAADLIGEAVLATATALALNGLGSTLYFVNQLSLRQTITKVRLLGRVTAARRFVLFGVATLGAFIGGALGETIGTARHPRGRRSSARRRTLAQSYSRQYAAPGWNSPVAMAQFSVPRAIGKCR